MFFDRKNRRAEALPRTVRKETRLAGARWSSASKLAAYRGVNGDYAAMGKNQGDGSYLIAAYERFRAAGGSHTAARCRSHAQTPNRRKRKK